MMNPTRLTASSPKYNSNLFPQTSASADKFISPSQIEAPKLHISNNKSSQYFNSVLLLALDAAMDKLLAMSILSFGPSATFWMGPPTKLMSLDGKKQGIRKEDNCGSGEEKRPAAKTQGRNGDRSSSPWFAPEFDGLNIFETFVFH